MKLLRIQTPIWTVLGLMLAAGIATAQPAESAGITREYDVVVSPSQDHAFREGLKRWEKCLHDNGSSQAFYVYDAETGNTSRYAVLVPYASWADMDKHTAAGKACRDTFVRDVEPHVTDASSSIFKVDAKITYDAGESSQPTPLAWVIHYRIKEGKYRKFIAAAHAISAAAAKTQWEAHFVGYDVLAGGRRSPQILFVLPNNSWADAGKMPSPSMRKMLESAYGKPGADALYRKLAHAARDAWSSIWSYDKELSFVPAKTQ